MSWAKQQSLSSGPDLCPEQAQCAQSTRCQAARPCSEKLCIPNRFSASVFNIAQNSAAISFEDGNRAFQIGISNAPISADIHLPPGKVERGSILARMR